MAKASNGRATAPKAAAPSKSGRVAIKGATPADKVQVAMARKVNAEAPKASDEAAARENTKSTVAAPEAQATDHEKRVAAQKLFDKADDDGKAEVLANEAARNAALGY